MSVRFLFMLAILLASCNRDPEVTVPNLVTLEVTEISSNSAKSGGHVYGDGHSPITARGIVWDISPGPVVGSANGIIITGPGMGSFYAYMTDLEYMVRYFVRAFAVNAKGISYGEEISFVTACMDLVVIHSEGNAAPESKTVTYKTVKSSLTGEPRCWIIQNLGADRPANSASDKDPQSAGWYWQFNRKQGYVARDGKVVPEVEWMTVIEENHDWLVPEDPCALLLGSGWRMPTAEEWQTIHMEGKWNSSEHAFNSELKLHAAGLLDPSSGSQTGQGTYGAYWTSSQFNETFGKYLYFYGGSSTMFHYAFSNYTKASGMSIRCLTERLY